MPGLYRNNKDTPEGKFLVVRRDGTIPEWPAFVLSARDPYAVEALIAYAKAAKDRGADQQFVSDVWDLAIAFDRYRREHGDGDPDAPRHREDDPRVVRAMQDKGHVYDGYLRIKEEVG